jgi:hypothetical protein
MSIKGQINTLPLLAQKIKHFQRIALIINYFPYILWKSSPKYLLMNMSPKIFLVFSGEKRGAQSHASKTFLKAV